MVVSHNEILITCQKALEARGFAQGEREDAADSLAWLAQIGLDMLPQLCCAIEQLHAQQTGWQITADSPERLKVTTNGGSCLQFGSLAADLAYSRARRFGLCTISLVGSEPGLWVGYLRHLAQKGVHCDANWHQGEHHHHLRFVAGAMFPDYVCTHTTGATADGVSVIVSTTPLASVEFSQRVIQSKTADFAAQRDACLQNGIVVDDEGWQLLQQAAKGILVEDTELSRLRGAGGQ